MLRPALQPKSRTGRKNPTQRHFDPPWTSFANQQFLGDHVSLLTAPEECCCWRLAQPFLAFPSVFLAIAILEDRPGKSGAAVLPRSAASQS
jgi:hypothetical protein